MQDLKYLQHQFSIQEQLDFEQKDSGLIDIVVHNQYARARISTYGGQVLSYYPHGSDADLLFVSDKAIFRPGKAIRGGIPICWPWFGNDTSGLGRPSHGFARNHQWTVVETAQQADGTTRIVLQLAASDASLSVWPYHFLLTLIVQVADTLTVELITQNTGRTLFALSQALHSYLNISDVGKVRIDNLGQVDYQDKLDKFKTKTQNGELHIDQALDRIYLHPSARIMLEDAGLSRKIQIDSGADHPWQTVIWNPWKKAVMGIRDLRQTHYRQFVCIETAHALPHAIKLAAGKQTRLTATYRMIAD